MIYSEEKIAKIAKVCHETNKAYCEVIGDYSQPRWEDAPLWQVESVKNGVKYHAANLDSSPRQSHENWLREKESDGWKYGPVKDPDKREHPCFVPYDQLPIEQQVKDYLFTTIVKHLLAYL